MPNNTENQLVSVINKTLFQGIYKDGVKKNKKNSLDFPVQKLKKIEEPNRMRINIY